MTHNDNFEVHGHKQHSVISTTTLNWFENMSVLLGTKSQVSLVLFYSLLLIFLIFKNVRFHLKFFLAKFTELIVFPKFNILYKCRKVRQMPFNLCFKYLHRGISYLISKCTMPYIIVFIVARFFRALN